MIELKGKQKLWYKYILEQVDKQDSYEDKMHALDTYKFVNPKDQSNTKSIQELFNQYPDVKSNVQNYLLKNLVLDLGNPDAKGFTFSKAIPDQEVIINLRAIEESKKNLLGDSYKVEGILTHNPEEYDQGEYYQRLIKDQDLALNKKDNLDKQISNIKSAIKASRAYFDQRANTNIISQGLGTDKPIDLDWYASIFPPFGALKLQTKIKDMIKGTNTKVFTDKTAYNPLEAVTDAVSLGIKGLMQAGAGWVDWFKEEGQEVVENRKLNYSDELEMSGSAWERENIAPNQAILDSLMNEKEELMNTDLLPETSLNYSNVTNKIEEYRNEKDLNQTRLDKINETGFDEALRLINPKAGNVQELYDEVLRSLDNLQE